MFKASMTGAKANITRTLTLPKSGKLDEKIMKGTYRIEIDDVAGLDVKSPVAKAILKAFPKVLENELNSLRKKWDGPSVKIWKDVGAALENKEMTEKKAAALVKAAEQNIADNWNEFGKKVAERLALSILENLAASEARKAKEKVGKSKIKFWSEDLKGNRINMWGSILGATVFAVVGSPLGWIAAGLSGALLLGKGYRNAWQVAQKQSVDVQTNLNNISDGLETAKGALKKLEPHIKLLNSAQKSTLAETAKAELELQKMRKELSKLETRAKSEKAAKEGDYLAKLSKAVETQFFKVEALRKTVEAQASLEKSIADATAAVEAASSEVSARRAGWDKIMAGYIKSTQSSDSLMDALSKLTKQLG